jgi:choice-of-anchor C domain-containing protein
MKRTLTLGLILVMLLACVGAVSANIVSNGGFESPGTFSGTFQPFASLDGWNVDSGSVDLINTYWENASGSYSIDLAGNAPANISQVLATTPNAKYDLSFQMAGNPDGAPTTKQVEVFWDGASQGIFTFATTGHSLASMGWTPKVKTGLVASGSSTVLKFVDVSGTDFYGAALDDIVVEPSQSTTPVPEFPTVALPAAFIIGLVGAVLFIQRTKEE